MSRKLEILRQLDSGRERDRRKWTGWDGNRIGMKIKESIRWVAVWLRDLHPLSTNAHCSNFGRVAVRGPW